MAIKLVRSATLSFGGNTYKLIKFAAAANGIKRDAVEVSVLGDTRKHFAVGALKDAGEYTATISGDECPAINVNSPYSIMDGSTTIVTGSAFVRSVTPSTIEVEGNRVCSYDIVLVPVMGV